MVASSTAPLVLLDADLAVVAISGSFCRTFKVDQATAVGRTIFDLGNGEWNVPQLRSLLTSTASGQAAIDAYEMDLKVPDQESPRRLVLNAHKLDYAGDAAVRLLLTVADVTDARVTEKLKDDLLREKAILILEVQHRVANSLQIIASVLLQSARNVQSEETRHHLRDAHSRVMSIATVQRQLSSSGAGDVELRPYFTQLCASLCASMIRDHNQTTLDVAVDDSVVRADISVSLGLIVTELVINALKHAFPDGRSGKITVGYQADGLDWKLKVTDNGVGMPSAGHQATAGLGTNIVESLARHLGARVELKDNAPGAEVTIVHSEVVSAAAKASPQPAGV